MSEWQSIKTAPKTDYIIGARWDGREFRDVGKYLFETRFGQEEWLEDEHGRSEPITHWIPMPGPKPMRASVEQAPKGPRPQSFSHGRRGATVVERPKRRTIVSVDLPQNTR